jgi:hypothetical protein
MPETIYRPITTDALVSQLEERKEKTERVNFSYENVDFAAEGEFGALSIDNEEFSLREAGWELLCNDLEVPRKFAERIDTDLRENVFNSLMGDTERLGAILVEGSDIRSFVDPAHPYVPTLNVFNKVMENVSDSFEVKNGFVNDDLTEFVLLSEDTQQEVVGSPITGGIRVVHSDGWSVSPRFDTYLYRLLCSNGMVSPLEGHKMRISGKNSEEILSRVGEFASHAEHKIDEMIEGFEATNDIEVPNPIQMIGHVQHEFGFPQRLANNLLDTAGSHSFLNTLPGNRLSTMFDIVNLLTYVASHEGEVTDANREALLEAGGQIALSHADRCGTCGSNLE